MVEAKENKYKTTYNNFIGLFGKSNGRLKPVEEKEHIDFVKAKLAIIDDGLYNYLKKYKSNTGW
jgi:hypothetical protein